jgi:hypothetical protein
MGRDKEAMYPHGCGGRPTVEPILCNIPVFPHPYRLVTIPPPGAD